MSEFDFSDSAAELERVQRENAALKLEAWRRKAIEEHPGAAAFADLLVAGSEADVIDLARDLEERVQSSGAGGFSPTPVNAAGVPVNAGSPALEPEPNEDEEFAAIKARAKESGNWSELLAAMRARQLDQQNQARGVGKWGY